jgi:putative CocE/NonD family hydrolase
MFAVLGPQLARALPPGEVVPAFEHVIDAMDEVGEIFARLPLRTIPPPQVPNETFQRFLDGMLDHTERDDYTRARSLPADRSSLTAPVLMFAGWHDLLLGADLDHWTALRQSAGSELARERSRLVIGPWAHGSLGSSVVGDVQMGARSRAEFMLFPHDLVAQQLRWFDRWLKDEPNAVETEPRVRYFLQGANEWRHADDWPIAGTVETPWYLQPSGGLAMEAPAADAEPSRYVYDPADPCPTVGGTHLLGHPYFQGPGDQRPILERDDVLFFTSALLDGDIDVVGAVRAALHVSTDAPDTDWVVKLCDVWPDGRAVGVCDGILRARYANGMDGAQPVPPAEVREVEVDLWSTAMRFRTGHRIGVLVTSSDFPRYDRNPNTGGTSADSAELRVARQTVHHDAVRPSRVVLPVFR